MGVVSNSTLGLLAKNTKAQMAANDGFIASSKVEVDTLIEQAKKQIAKYFDDLFALDLPFSATIRMDFNNNDGEGDFRIGLVHENSKKLAYFSHSNYRDMLISTTHIENGKKIDYPEQDKSDFCWNYGFIENQIHSQDEYACKQIMQCFDTIQNKFNLKVLNYINDSYCRSERDAKAKKRTLSVLREYVKEDDSDK